MRLLLDTHLVVWWFRSDKQLRDSWAREIRSSANEVFLSAASAWEIEVKKRIGKLVFDSTVSEIAADNGFAILDITVADATLAGSLDWNHKDPFDRILVAQALERRLILVTADAAMLTAPGARFLD